jgi:hypothetical protein
MIKRRIIWAISLIAVAATICFGRSILERKMYFLNNDMEIKEARFWAIYLGNFDCKLTRKYPGESEGQIDASVNLQLISSGYIEGNGYGAKGKVSTLPTMLLKNGDKEHSIELDSIDYIGNRGQSVRLLNGKKGDFIIDIEGDQQKPKRFLLREYKVVDYYGEEILKESAEDEQHIVAISFTKEGIQRAQKAAKEK